MTFFKIPKDRFFWETIYFHNKICHGTHDRCWMKQTSVTLNSCGASRISNWLIYEPTCIRNMRVSLLCPWKVGKLAQEMMVWSLLTGKTFHKHQKLGLSCISLGWWDGIDGGKAFKSLVEICSVCWSVQSVFQRTILYFDENVSKQISCHGTLLFQHLLCWAKTEGEEMQN